MLLRHTAQRALVLNSAVHRSFSSSSCTSTPSSFSLRTPFIHPSSLSFLQSTKKLTKERDARTSAPNRFFSSSAPSSSSSPSSTRRPSMKESSSEAAQRSFALRLYKAILRSHRTVLPDAMRSLGDTYVREEFKLHKTAKPQHLNGFFMAWIGYLEMMRSQSPGSWGEQLTAEQLDALSDEQKAQLALLQKSAATLDEQWSGMEKEGNPITIPEAQDDGDSRRQ